MKTLIVALLAVVEFLCAGAVVAQTCPFRLSFGSSGTEDGQFASPRSTAVNALGDIIVSDSDNNRIQIFDADGQHLLSFGAFGSNDGEFDSPQGVALDAADNIVVADSGNNRIQVFDPTGAHLLTFGLPILATNGMADGQFNSPQGVTVNGAGNIVVADTGNHRIQVFDAAGTHLLTFGSFGAGKRKLQSPSGVAVDALGNIVVADTFNQRIQVYSAAGVHQFSFGSFGSADGLFKFPEDVTIDIDGKIVVADAGNDRFQFFNAAGVHLFSYGSSGSGFGEFGFPQSVGVGTINQLAVADRDNARVQVFACGPDLVVSQTNDVNGGLPIGSSFKWTVHVANNAASDALVPDDTLIFKNDLPAASYGEPLLTNIANITNADSIRCGIQGTTLRCRAKTGDVTLAGSFGVDKGQFDVEVVVTPLAIGGLTSPASGGVCSVDIDEQVLESNEANNNCADALSVVAAIPTPVLGPWSLGLVAVFLGLTAVWFTRRRTLTGFDS